MRAEGRGALKYNPAIIIFCYELSQAGFNDIFVPTPIYMDSAAYIIFRPGNNGVWCILDTRKYFGSQKILTEITAILS